MHIKIIKNGPYLVVGNIPLDEKVIIQERHGVHFEDVKTYETKESYTLCRCGHSKNKPFCDGKHTKHNFYGAETANRKPFMERAKLYKSKSLILADVESLCAFARFCHSELGNVWTATEESDEIEKADAAIKMACECPAGRLVMIDRETNRPIEPYYEPSISIIKDPSRKCNGPLFIKGGIPIIGEDGSEYEVRNRVTLCSCGESFNKPFCDATHVDLGYAKDNIEED